MAERRRKDVHDEGDERSEQRTGEDADEPGEVHVDTTEHRDVQLEDGETGRGDDAGERDLACLAGAATESIDGVADEDGTEDGPEGQCPERERALAEVNVSHS